jgi:hypothetical protein
MHSKATLEIKKRATVRQILLTILYEEFVLFLTKHVYQQKLLIGMSVTIDIIKQIMGDSLQQ